MADTLLRTKLYIPPLRPHAVTRPRLVERLNQGLQLGHKLTLVSAPAGFGKTTLISEWVNTLHTQGTQTHIAWLALDESDSDVTRFLMYLATALKEAGAGGTRTGSGALAMLCSSHPRPTDVVLTALINEMDTFLDETVLVLDDYQLLDSPPVDEALTFLLEHLPPQIHILIATRVDPSLPLARLRAGGKLIEMRAVDLRFTSSETADFLNQTMGLNLSTEQVTALEQRTEGWIAGLHLAAISIQGHKDPANLIQSFTSGHRFVLDYLVEEVFAQQPEHIQTFLLQTSILSRFTGSLCAAVCFGTATATGSADCQATLNTLANANLFIVPLDEERCWFRYHRLFADLLQQHLAQTQPENLSELHRRASAWYEENGDSDEAIEHALRGEDPARAARLIEEVADALWQGGRHARLQRWLAQLPVELFVTKPHLSIFHAWYLFAGGQPDAAEQALQSVERSLDAGKNCAGEPELLRPDMAASIYRARLQGRAAAVRAFMSSYQGDIPGIVRHAQQALALLPRQDLTWRSITLLTLADGHGFAGDLRAAYRARRRALQGCEATGDLYLVMLANLKLAITLRAQGRLQQTIAICRQQVQLAEEGGLLRTPLGGSLLTVWAEVLAELNNLDEALTQAGTGVALAERGVDLAIRGWSYLCLMRILFSAGDLAAAAELVAKVENLARAARMPGWITNQIATWQARLWLEQGNLESAAQWIEARGLATDDGPGSLHTVDFFALVDYILLARIRMAQGRWEEAATLLARLLQIARQAGRTAAVLEILLLEAMTMQAMGNTARAMTRLARALALAEPHGFVRIFVDEGPPMARLLYAALSHQVAPGYTGRLLAAFPVPELPQTSSPQPSTGQYELVEPLSERELEVLRLIAEGLTNQQIGSRLFLSLNTVKVHTRNIYGKLAVHSRTQAVARAKELGILPAI